MHRFMPLNDRIMAFVALVVLFQLAANPLQAAAMMKQYPHLQVNDTIETLMQHPAFEGFAQHLLTRDGDSANLHLRLSGIQALLPYHGFVDTDTVLGALNHMIDDAADGKTVFYDFYTAQQKQCDPSKASTGIFFFRGKPGAPFAVICPGGGFSYVGSVHEGFPYAVELSKKGLNAFVLRYRVGQGGNIAASDLAAALSYIVAHAEELGVRPEQYSLWGSSAGARMAAAISSYGVAAYEESSLPRPAAVVMAYTGHSDYSLADPPTFVIVSADDPIANAIAVERRVQAMRRAGIDVEFVKFQHAGHGFGLGVGTDAEGWIDRAIQFWEKHMR